MEPTLVVVFDLDGTLVDSAPGIARVLDVMRSERGLPPHPIGLYRRWISLGVQHLVAFALDVPDPADETSIAAFRIRYRAAPCSPADLYPGVGPALDQLDAAGAAMGVCTNKPQNLSTKVLAETGIARHFRALVGGDAVAACKPDPGHLSATLQQMGCMGLPFFYVGDSVIDADAADATDATFLWATWGYGIADEMMGRGLPVHRPEDVVATVRQSRHQ